MPRWAWRSLTLLFVTLKLNQAQNVTFKRLVNSRIDVELEKQRAEAAERSALIERSLARKLADTDVLTGLGNRRALLAEIEVRTPVAATCPFAVALLDLDGSRRSTTRSGMRRATNCWSRSAAA